MQNLTTGQKIHRDLIVNLAKASDGRATFTTEQTAPGTVLLLSDGLPVASFDLSDTHLSEERLRALPGAVEFMIRLHQLDAANERELVAA